jgi:hypothetical protein
MLAHEMAVRAFGFLDRGVPHLVPDPAIVGARLEEPRAIARAEPVPGRPILAKGILIAAMNMAQAPGFPVCQ